jgi:hypothetical protein
LSRLEENQQGSWNQPNEYKHQKNCLPCKTTSMVACTKPYQPWHHCKTPHDYEKPFHPAWYMLKCTNHHNGCNASQLWPQGSKQKEGQLIQTQLALWLYSLPWFQQISNFIDLCEEAGCLC